MHERLRLELLRRIQRGSVSVSLLARQTGLGQSHLSNFLRGKRQLSTHSIDRVLAAQHLEAADLLSPSAHAQPAGPERSQVPIVAHAVALFEPFIRPAAVQGLLHVQERTLETCRARASAPRRAWERFVAVQVAAADALPMEPLLLPDAIVLLDRHYTSPAPYRAGKMTLLALRRGAHLTLRYVDVLGSRLILRPHNIHFPPDVLEISPGDDISELIVGRVALIVNTP